MASKSWRALLKNALPNLLTMGNGICGFSALLCAAASMADKSNADNYLVYSIVLIALAMVFDALDGKIARLTGSTSNIGAQLDSLCDAVSFGVAPAFVIYFALADHLSHKLLWVTGITYMCCAIFRLARFNIETTDHSEESHLWFSGLPSPAAATTVMLAACCFNLLPASYLDIGAPVAALVTLMAALLMVSRVRFPHLGLVIKALKGGK